MNQNTACTMLSGIPEAIEVGETLKDRVMFTAPPGTKERLKAWADSERRTVSNLCEGIVLEALERWEAEQHGKQNPSTSTTE